MIMTDKLGAGGKMNRINREGNVKRRGWIYLAFTVLLASATMGLSACGEKESMPGTQPNSPQRQTVKPTITGTKLTPKAVMASKSGPGTDPTGIMDGDISTGWTAGDTAPQWIQIDLGQPTGISEVLLDINQTPDGPTTHQVYGGPSPDNLKLIVDFVGTNM